MRRWQWTLAETVSELPEWSSEDWQNEWPDAMRRLNLLACGVVGHRARTHHEQGKAKAYDWRQCARCGWVFWGEPMPMWEHIIRAYPAHTFASMLTRPSPFREALRA